MSLIDLKIKEDKIAKMGVSSLPTRPNAPVTSGGQGLTPSQMRAKFDELPKHIAEKFNALIDRIPYLADDIIVDGKSLSKYLSDLSALVDGDSSDSDYEEILSKLNSFILEQAVRDSVQDALITSQARQFNNLMVDIENFKATLADSVAEVEDSYKSRITADGLDIYDNQNTFVKRIDGATVASANILPPPENWYESTTKNGVTFTVDKEKGVITMNGTATERAFFFYSPHIPVSVGSYVIGAKENGDFLVMGDVNKDGAWYKSIVKSITLEEEGNYTIVPYIQVQEGKTLNNVVVRPYLQRGYTAMPWNKPFKGLQTAKIDRIVSTGRNVADFNAMAEYFAANETGASIVTFDGKRCLRIQNAGHSVRVYMPNNLIRSIRFNAYADGTNPPSSFFTIGHTAGDFYTEHLKTYYEWVNVAKHRNDGGHITYLQLYTFDNSAVYIDIDSFTFSTSVPSVECTPYTESVYQLPQTVELGEYDHIDVEEGKIYRYTQTLNPATASIRRDTVSGLGDRGFYVSLSVPPLMLPDSSGYYDYGYGVSADFEWRSAEELYENNTFAVYNGNLMFRSDDCADVETFRAKLVAGKTVYRTEKPISVEDIDIPKSYKAWNGGTETIIGADDAMNEYANPTITQEYLVKGAI